MAAAAEEKWHAAQERRGRAASARKALEARRLREYGVRSEEHAARSEQLQRAQSDHALLVVQEIRRRDYDEGRQMRAALHAKARADEQSRRAAVLVVAVQVHVAVAAATPTRNQAPPPTPNQAPLLPVTRRDLFHASHQVPRGSPPGSPLASRHGGAKGGDVARFLPKALASAPIGSPSQAALPTRQSEVRRVPLHPRPYPPPLPTHTQRPACSLQP